MKSLILFLALMTNFAQAAESSAPRIQCLQAGTVLSNDRAYYSDLQTYFSEAKLVSPSSGILIYRQGLTRQTVRSDITLAIDPATKKATIVVDLKDAVTGDYLESLSGNIDYSQAKKPEFAVSKKPLGDDTYANDIHYFSLENLDLWLNSTNFADRSFVKMNGKNYVGIKNGVDSDLHSQRYAKPEPVRMWDFAVSCKFMINGNFEVPY